MSLIERDVLVPIVDALRRDDIDYRGVIYAGLMLTPGGPKVLEFNCRFGDPECQPLMARVRGDLLELMSLTAQGRLDEARIDWAPEHACCVVLASRGYPDKPALDVPITGVEDAEKMPGVVVNYAGVKRRADGTLVTAGGRVLGVTGLGATLEEARARAYDACEKIRFEGKTLRTDIGAPRAVGARRVRL
jgi:phosphoribosylamine--glycine ligase